MWEARATSTFTWNLFIEIYTHIYIYILKNCLHWFRFLMGLSWLKLIGLGGRQEQTTSFPANNGTPRHPQHTVVPLRAIFRLNNSTLDVLLARAIGITGNRSSGIKFSRLIEDRKQKHSCRNTEGWLRRITVTNENWENWSEVGKEGKSLSSKRPTLFRFLSRCREKGRRIRRSFALEKRM